MAKWKKGNPSPNPSGRPAIPAEIRELKALNRIELERRLNEFMQLTPQQLSKIKNNPESTTLELLIVSIITHAINKGDHTRFNFLLEQLLGKLKENVNVEGQMGIKIIVEDYLN